MNANTRTVTRPDNVLPALFGAFISMFLCSQNAAAFEIRSIDGTGNNLTNSDWGSLDTQLLRQGAADYSDGVSSASGALRPSVRLISNDIAAQSISSPNSRGISSMVWQWGQFIDHDIDLTEGASPTESLPIAVPIGDPHFDPTSTGTQTIGLNRSAYDLTTGTGVANPRQQVNQISSWIDASNVYGSNATRAMALRTSFGGRLATSAGDLLPFNTGGLHNAGGPSSSLFLAGDIRANEQVGLTSMHTLFVREHNRRADEIASANPGMSDEAIYQRARKIVGAEIQKITYDDFLPALLGSGAISAYAGYNSSVNGAIKNEFSTAAYRFGHTMLPTQLLRLDNGGNEIGAGNLALQNGFFNPAEVSSVDIDPYLKGLATQMAQEVDNMVVDDVRNFLFGPPGSGGFDLASLNIQRGRDHGIADYNQMRLDYGLAPVAAFADISSDPVIQSILESLYVDVNSIDAWVGGLAEDHLFGGSLGELFSTVLVDQFEVLRDADRFWYENDDYFLGDLALLSEIGSLNLGDIIELNTGVVGLQDNVFFAAVPLPPAAWLFATGLLGMAGLGRQRTART